MMKQLLILLFAVCFAVTAHAQDINVQSVKLGEAGEAWVIESHDVPTISVQLSFSGAGSISDENGKLGRAEMVASLLDEGAGEMDELAFNQTLEDHAIQLGFGVGKDTLTVSLQTLSEHADKAFELMALALAKPRFEQPAIDRVKAQMQTTLRHLDESPRYVASQALIEQLYGDHAYARPSDGTKEGIEALTREDLLAYMKANVALSNMVVGVVGDIAPDELQSLVEKHFGDLPKTAAEQTKPEHAKVQAAGQTEVVRRSLPQTVVLIGSEGISHDDPDYYKAIVMNHLLGGGTLTSKLGDEIREKRGLAYYAYTALRDMDYGEFLTGGFGTRNDQAAEALKVMMSTIRRVYDGEISQEELDDAKGYIIGAWPLSLTSNANLAAMLVTMQRDGLGKDYIAKRNSYYESITLEDVKGVAKRLLDADRMIVVGVGDPAQNLADYR